MAADSRLTLNFDDPAAPSPVAPSPGSANATPPKQKVSVPQSDAQQKLFILDGRIGISTFGDAGIGGVPITGFIESFMLTLKAQVSPEEVAKGLLAYFGNINPALATFFHVAGYSPKNNELSAETWSVEVAKSNAEEGNAGNQGAMWGGEIDIMSRMVSQVYEKDAAGNYKQIPFYGIPWDFFTLQDAIDFAVHAVRSTADTMRFMMRLRTVGGPIDVLVIKPNGAEWLEKKKLVFR